ncbi:MAG: hypothetical protein A3F72_03595 [Bacteroidetes bacterium RIFCSPLOWO2_12_FULL_35_15]|nr:MAG: hypothetical protein A3F72_03595 [Bacteroidetes bacterium RIFCSPLOWO2_12_FULL_35_15]
MKEVFEIAEKLENKLFALQQPTFVRDYILNSAEGTNEEKATSIENVFKSINEIRDAWDDVLLKLLVSNIPNSEKWNIFLQLEKGVTKCLEKNSPAIMNEVVKNTKLGPSITILYPAECNEYKKVVDVFVSDYKNVFLKYNNSLTISDAQNKPKQKKQVEEKVTIPHRIGWHNNVKRKGETINFENFFGELIRDETLTLANGRINKQEIFKILREIFDIVNKVERGNTKSKKSTAVKDTSQQVSQCLIWTKSLEEFCEKFGQLIHYKGETTLFLGFDEKGDATPIGEVLYKVFVINKKVKDQKIPVKESSFLTSFRRNSVKR